MWIVTTGWSVLLWCYINKKKLHGSFPDSSTRFQTRLWSELIRYNVRTGWRPHKEFITIVGNFGEHAYSSNRTRISPKPTSHKVPALSKLDYNRLLKVTKNLPTRRSLSDWPGALSCDLVLNASSSLRLATSGKKEITTSQYFWKRRSEFTAADSWHASQLFH